MGNYVEAVIAVAEAEKGYLEKKSNASLDSKTANAGYSNFTKYWRDLYPAFQGQPWCDAYVDWLFIVTYGKDEADKLLCGGVNSYYCPTSAKRFYEKNKLDNIPKVGDQVFFVRPGASVRSGRWSLLNANQKKSLLDTAYHTGIVTRVDSDYVYTSEGNTSSSSGVIPNGGGVWNKKYLRTTYQDKMLFGHPPYDVKPEAKYDPIVIPVNTSGTLNKTPLVIGKVRLSNPAPGNFLNVRTWAGAEYPNISSWPRLSHGNAVDVCDAVKAKDGTVWFYIRIAAMYYGFVRSDFIVRY